MQYITTYFWHPGSGGRKNEDSLSLQCVLLKKQEAALLVVCDGIGGLAVGEWSSGFVAEQLSQWFWENAVKSLKRCRWKKILTNSVIRKFASMQEELEWFQKRENLLSGTTCTMAVVYRRKFLVVHCGDSRAYLLGKIEKCLTKDHSKEGKLLRCLGNYGFWRPDVCTGRLGRGEILLLCTDGFCREAPGGFFRESLWEAEGSLERKGEQCGPFPFGTWGAGQSDCSCSADRRAVYLLRERIGEKYRVLRKVASGGGGRVYQVYDERLEKCWAAKLLERDSAEEKILCGAQSEFWVRIVDVVEQEGEQFLIMDWIEGESLQQYLDRGEAFPVREGVRIGVALCRALAQLHALEPPVLYLDCKPSNIMLQKDGKVVLVDFGSAVRMETHMVLPRTASFGYAAPEQLCPDPQKRMVDERSDLYSLGKTLYAILGGQCPDRPPYGTVGLHRLNGAVPVGVCRIVEKCCAVKREKRYQTAAAVQRALENYEKVQKNRNRLWKGAIGLFLTALCFAAWEFAGSIMERSDTGGVHKGIAWTLAAWVLGKMICSVFYRDRQKWEMKKSVVRTLKKQGIFLGVLLGLCLSLPLPGSEARGTVPPKVILRDGNMRKLLVRQGGVLEAADSIFMELDPNLFDTEQIYRISVICREEEGETTRLEFAYCPKEK